MILSPQLQPRLTDCWDPSGSTLLKQGDLLSPNTQGSPVLQGLGPAKKEGLFLVLHGGHTGWLGVLIGRPLLAARKEKRPLRMFVLWVQSPWKLDNLSSPSWPRRIIQDLNFKLKMERIGFNFQINIVLPAILHDTLSEMQTRPPGVSLRGSLSENRNVNVKYVVEFLLNSYVFWRNCFKKNRDWLEGDIWPLVNDGTILSLEKR